MSYGNNTFTIYKPMFFEFPEDLEAYYDIAYNVMIGPAIKICNNVTAVKSDDHSLFYFPAGTWCSLFEPIGNCTTNLIGSQVLLSSEFD